MRLLARNARDTDFADACAARDWTVTGEALDALVTETQRGFEAAELSENN